jgi:hypothetical protein
MILVRGGAFGWKVDELPIVHDLKLSILRNQFTVIIGPVASGKNDTTEGTSRGNPEMGRTHTPFNLGLLVLRLNTVATQSDHPEKCDWLFSIGSGMV